MKQKSFKRCFFILGIVLIISCKGGSTTTTPTTTTTEPVSVPSAPTVDVTGKSVTWSPVSEADSYNAYVNCVFTGGSGTCSDWNITGLGVYVGVESPFQEPTNGEGFDVKISVHITAVNSAGESSKSNAALFAYNSM